MNMPTVNLEWETAGAKLETIATIYFSKKKMFSR